MEQMLQTEYECRHCRKVVSIEQHMKNRYCPSCGTLLSKPLRPKPWVFQFNPSTYRWFDRLKENKETEQWLTSRHVRDIREGDKVAIWASGEKAGIYAIGEIVTNPKMNPLDPKQEKYWTNKEDICKFEENCSVIVKYSKVIIDRPLLESKCHSDPFLADMAVLKGAQGTNFSLTRKQWNRIVELTG